MYRLLGSGELRETSNQIVGRFYADQAFMAYETGCMKKVRYLALKAFGADWRWLANRGLWKIVLRAPRHS
jgi:hypothetical protein